MSDHGDPLLSRLRERASKESTRSKAGIWMIDNSAAFAELIRRHGADWSGWAEDFVSEGRVPTPEDWETDREKAKARIGESLRRTWLRVRGREEASGAAPRPRRSAPA